MQTPRRAWNSATVDEISAAPMYPLERGEWNGIPRHPAWLHWFSTRHVELVPALSEHEHARSSTGGVLVVDDRNLVHDAGHFLAALPDEVYRTCFGPDASPQPELANHGFKTRPAARTLSLAEDA